jgi:hypothetical protein
MSTLPTTLLHPLALAGALWVLLLWIAGKVLGRPAPRLWQAGLGALAVALLFVPVGPVSLGRWVESFYPNPSLPGIAFVLALLWRSLLHRDLLRPADLRALLAFTAVAGSLLYLNPLWGRAADFYYFGWRSGPAIWTITAVALFLLAVGNRAGLVLTAALGAFALSALESNNAWDYVVDPAVWLVSLGALGLRGMAAVQRRWTERSARASAPVSGAERETTPVASVPRSAPADL